MKRILTPFMIALIAALFATATYTGTAQLPSDSDLVYVRFTATTTTADFGVRPVVGLQKEQFKLSEDNTPQDIAYFSKESLPLHVGILLDDSGSTKDDVKAKTLSGMSKFGRRDDEFFLLESRRGPLNDAILNALNTFAQSGKNGKAALVLYTSKRNSGEYSFARVRERLKELDIQLYVVGLYASSDIPSENAKQAFKDLAELTGGSAFFPASTFQVDDVNRKIVAELRNQYLIGYRSTNVATDGRWRKIKITGEYLDKVSKKVAKFGIHAKPGYYASTVTTATK